MLLDRGLVRPGRRLAPTCGFHVLGVSHLHEDPGRVVVAIKASVEIGGFPPAGSLPWVTASGSTLSRMPHVSG